MTNLLKTTDEIIIKLSYIKSINTLLTSQIENYFAPLSEAIGHEQAVALLDSIRLIGSLSGDVVDQIDLEIESPLLKEIS